MECEAHPARIARSRRLYEGAIHARSMVCRRRDKHLRFVHSCTQWRLEQRAVLRRPRRTDHRVGRPSGQPLAERRTVQPRCLARKISPLQSAGIQRLVLHQRTGVGRLARYSHSRPHWQCKEPGRCLALDEFEFCEARKNVSGQSGCPANLGSHRRKLVRGIFSEIRGGHGPFSLPADPGVSRLDSANRGAPETSPWFLPGARSERSFRREYGRF